IGRRTSRDGSALKPNYPPPRRHATAWAAFQTQLVPASVARPMNALASPPIPADATPVMAQYFEAKARQPDALVFFRMGDFYELFFDDAVKAAGALGIALTARGKHAGQDIPMAGVPVHAAEAYLAKLIRAGFKV